MILSHEHRFVFIKGVKVAGTSAEIALSQICGAEDVITPVTPVDERYRLGTAGEPRNYASHLYPRWFRPRVERRFVESVRTASGDQLAGIRLPRSRFFNHMPLSRVLEILPEARHYEVVFVERSPYAKVLSQANWRRSQREYRSGKLLEMSASFVEQAVDEVLESGAFSRVVNIERYRGPDGEIRGTMWRTDTLAADIARFFEGRGLSQIPVVHAKRGFGSEKADPASLLRADQIATINREFTQEFTQFGWPMLDA